MPEFLALGWWVSLQPSDFHAMEKALPTFGGSGSLFPEFPGRTHGDLFPFLRYEGTLEHFEDISIESFVVVEKSVQGRLVFGRRHGPVIIRNQNKNLAAPWGRHSAWIAERGFPVAPPSVQNATEADRYLPPGGVRLYLLQRVAGHNYAGFTKGEAPPDLPTDHPSRALYQSGRASLIRPEDWVVND